jgi:acetyltransferase-like isoleucine patch superfamily enzyme
MKLQQRIGSAWRSPVLVWPLLRNEMGFMVRIRLHVLARWNGTRLVMKGPVRQEHPVRIQGRGTLQIDRGVVLGSILAGAPGHPILFQPRFRDTEISLGKGAQIMNGCQFIAFERIDIGPKCAIGPGCLFMDNDGHEIHPERRHEQGKTAPVLLEENVWLGARVTILKGVRIGRDAIVGSGAVVTKDVADGDIVVGNPARRIGSAYAC